MRLVAVGTGTVVPEGDRGGSCFFLDTGDARLLLDCGPGAVQSLARQLLPWESVTDLLISHFHTDHIGAVPALLFALKHGVLPPRRQPLDVWGPKGTAELFARLAAAFGEYVLDPGFALHVHELAPDDPREVRGEFEIAVHDTPHTDESHAMRIRAGAGVVGYTADTGLPPGEAESLGAFLGGSQLLIAECSLADDEVGDNHLSPSRLARLASVARPGLLWITHVYPHLRHRDDVAELVRSAGYEGRAHVVADGDVWQAAS